VATDDVIVENAAAMQSQTQILAAFVKCEPGSL
jgi:hypothetical protein